VNLVVGRDVAKKAVNPRVIGLLQRRHLLIGWLGLLVFLTLGVVLEALHGFKVGFYLDAHNSARRLMWTLCHAHGTLFSIVHIAFACSLGLLESVPWRSARLVSWCLIGAIIVMPLGFFLGGFQVYGGDPGIGVLIVPIGALMLLCGVATFSMILARSSILRSGSFATEDHSRTAGTRSGRRKGQR
jgi:hypothetical protein